MNGLRFKVGELAVVAIAKAELCGLPCEIVEAGPFPVGHIFKAKNGGRRKLRGATCDYLIDVGEEEFRACWEWQLRKLDPPAEPKTMTVVEGVEV